MKTLVYTRFSPRPDAHEAQSLEVQLAVCQAYCHMKALEVVGVIRDPETSARKVPLRDRTGGAELLERIASGEIKHVVCQKLDRIFRNTVDGLTTMEVFEDRGVALHFADQGGCSLNCSTATGKLVMTFLLGVASFEPEMTAERTSGAMRRYQSQGRSMGGQAPFGYRREGKALVADHEELATIQMIVQDRSLGDSPGKIAEKLNAMERPCRGSKWHRTTVGRILTTMVQAKG